MPTSTKYTGNEFISRRQRQDSVVLYNRRSDEVSKQAVYVEKALTWVRVELLQAVNFTQRGEEKNVQCKLIVELRDGNPGYKNLNQWNETDSLQWTVQPGRDYFIYKGNKFMINSLIERYNINGKVDILEIVAQ